MKSGSTNIKSNGENTKQSGGQELGKEPSLDILTLRYRRTDFENLQELRVDHVNEILEGIHEFYDGLIKAGVFQLHDSGEGELYVRPAKEGSFVIEVVREFFESFDGIQELYDKAKVGAEDLVLFGGPTLFGALALATRSLRADVEDVEQYDEHHVKIKWQNKMVDIVPNAVWEELNKKPKRRRAQMRKLMAALEDDRVDILEINPGEFDPSKPTQPCVRLDKEDFETASSTEESEEETRYRSFQGHIRAIDFENPRRWKVETPQGTRTVEISDQQFLENVSSGSPILPHDIFHMALREDRIVKDGRTSTILTVYKIEKIRSEEGDEADSRQPEADD